jgi:AcrR family transcriptional regulator
MSTKERRQRQFAEREQLFLDTAWELIRRDGLLNLQMGRLAAECDYAVGTLYQHFASKEDLLLALAGSSMSGRIELFQRVADWAAPSRERMLGFAVADVLFAEHEPEFFRLSQYVSTQVVWAATSAARRETVLGACRPLGELVDRVVNAAIAAGDVDSGAFDSQELGCGLWAMCEGMHQLVHADGVLDMQRVTRPYHLLLRQANALLNGLGWRPLLTPDDGAAQRALLARMMQELFPDFPAPALLADDGRPPAG